MVNKVDNSLLLRNLYGKLTLNLNPEQRNAIANNLFQVEIINPLISGMNKKAQDFFKGNDFSEFNSKIYRMRYSHIDFSPYHIQTVIFKIYSLYETAINNALEANNAFMVDTFKSQFELFSNNQRINYYALTDTIPSFAINFFLEKLKTQNIQEISRFIFNNIPRGTDLNETILNDIFSIIKDKIKVDHFDENKEGMFDIFVLDILHKVYESDIIDYVDIFPKYLSNKAKFLSIDDGINLCKTNDDIQAINIEVDYRCFSQHFFISKNSKFQYGTFLMDKRVNTIFIEKINNLLNILRERDFFKSIDYVFDDQYGKISSNMIFSIEYKQDHIHSVANNEKLEQLIRKSFNTIYSQEKQLLTGKNIQFNNNEIESFIHEYSLATSLVEKDTIERIKRKI